MKLGEQWLWSRGGRTMADVFVDNEGQYVWMEAPTGKVKVYIPSYDYLQLEFGKHLSNHPDMLE